MGSKTSQKASLFLTLNLLGYVLSATACITVSGGNGGEGCTPSSGGGNATVPGVQQPGTCPTDTLKLGVCANVLNGLVAVAIGNPPTTPCCTLIARLLDLEAAVCLCTAIKANVIGINLNVPISVSVLLNVCGKNPPAGFTCA